MVNTKIKLDKILSILVLISATAFAVLTVINLTGGFSNPAQTVNGVRVGTDIGNAAPDFSVKTTDGNTISLSNFTSQKKPTILYFWATWCPFCSDEFNRMDSVYAKYNGKVDVLAIDMDTSENLKTISDYQSQHHHAWIFAAGNDDVLRKYHITTTSTKYVIDANGIIQTKGTGEISTDKLDSAFRMALGQL